MRLFTQLVWSVAWLSETSHVPVCTIITGIFLGCSILTFFRYLIAFFLSSFIYILNIFISKGGVARDVDWVISGRMLRCLSDGNTKDLI